MMGRVRGLPPDHVSTVTCAGQRQAAGSVTRRTCWLITRMAVAMPRLVTSGARHPPFRVRVEHGPPRGNESLAGRELSRLRSDVVRSEGLRPWGVGEQRCFWQQVHALQITEVSHRRHQR